MQYYSLINILHTTLENKFKPLAWKSQYIYTRLYKVLIVLLTSDFVFSCLPKNKYYKNIMTYDTIGK